MKKWYAQPKARTTRDRRMSSRQVDHANLAVSPDWTRWVRTGAEGPKDALRKRAQLEQLTNTTTLWGLPRDIHDRIMIRYYQSIFDKRPHELVLQSVGQAMSLFMRSGYRMAPSTEAGLRRKWGGFYHHPGCNHDICDQTGNPERKWTRLREDPGFESVESPGVLDGLRLLWCIEGGPLEREWVHPDCYNHKDGLVPKIIMIQDRGYPRMLPRCSRCHRSLSLETEYARFLHWHPRFRTPAYARKIKLISPNSARAKRLWNEFLTDLRGKRVRGEVRHCLRRCCRYHDVVNPPTKEPPLPAALERDQ